MQYYDRKAVGMRIKQTRQGRGLTQCGLAQQLDYSNERQLQRIESGMTSCSVDKLMEIAQILEVSTDYLLFGIRREGEGVRKYFQGKTEKQAEYLYLLLKTAGENLGLLDG